VLGFGDARRIAIAEQLIAFAARRRDGLMSRQQLRYRFVVRSDVWLQFVVILGIVCAELTLSPPHAVAQAPSQWKVSLALIRIASTCDGERGSIRATGRTLAYFSQGMPYPVWQVELEPDGSADKVIGRYIHSSRNVRVKVAAGTGPREVTSLDETSLCSFRYIPD